MADDTIKTVEVSTNNLSRLDRKIDKLVDESQDVRIAYARMEGLFDAFVKSNERFDHEIANLREHVTQLRIKAGVAGSIAGVVAAIVTTIIVRALGK
jgi:septation ring formation regulator EzrA